ncbi:MAG: B12-binding domain-containing radical SAM protein [Elusimicrobia bacterium]|nr:B12-binding domain-containing radical SAM protein [Elusimicrobiota bacterium]
MKVTFGYHSWTGEYGLFGHFAKRNSTWPPLNLALLGAIVEASGHKAMIIDGEAMGLKADKLAKAIIESKPDIVGLTCYSPFFHLSTDVAKAVKKLDPNMPIMVGGPHLTIMKEKAMLPHFDYGFIGETEKSLPAFLEAFQTDRDFSKVHGLMYRKGEEIVNTGEPQWVEAESATKGINIGKYYPLDEFPLPARHLLPMNKYRLGTMHGRRHFTSIQTMRGCPWTCIFCASAALKTTRVVMRSPKSVVDEMVKVKRDFPFIDHFYVVDDVLTLWPKHIREICDRINAEGLKITFEGSTRANLVDNELIKYMAKTGLVRLSFGLETVDPQMRETMQKKVPMEAYVKANRICADNNVEAMNSMMLGLPGETKETIRTTLQWLRNARDVKQANFAIAIPYPGTEFHDMAINGTHGVELLSEDFSEYLRYGSAVTKIGELTPKDLIDLQNEGFVSIYSAPWRWMPVWHKHGTIGFLLMMWRVVKLWKRKFFEAAQPFRVHPGVP